MKKKTKTKYEKGEIYFNKKKIDQSLELSPCGQKENFPVARPFQWGDQKSCSFNGQIESRITDCAFCLVTQSCLTLCDPIDCSLSGSSVHGILVAISFSRESTQPRD